MRSLLTSISVNGDGTTNGIEVNSDGSLLIDEGIIPDYATALEIDFKVLFNEASQFTEASNQVYTARFTLGDIQWDEADSNYEGLVFYALGDKEVPIYYPALVNH